VWAAGVFDVLATTWMLLALLVLLRPAPRVSGSLDIILVSGLAILAFFTKESAVALPILAIVVLAPSYWRKKGSSSQLVLLSALLVSTGAYFVWRIITGLAIAGTSGVTRYMAKEQLSRTFGTLAIPFSSDTIQSFPVLAFLLAAGVVLLATASVVIPERRSSAHVVAVQGLLWCAIAAAPTIGFLFIGQ